MTRELPKIIEGAGIVMASLTGGKTKTPVSGKGSKGTQSWTISDVMERLDIPAGGEDAVKAYVKKNLTSFKRQAVKQVPEAPQEALLSMFEAAINDGHIKFGDDSGEERIEVSQDAVKSALKGLLTKRNSTISHLYKMHEDFNQRFFAGQLSEPVITIDKLSNRTLANYTEGADASALEHHIRFNMNFIALQLEDDNMERILETLLHEMIHQFQDEVLYTLGSAEPKEITMLQMNEDGTPEYVKALQKKRPREWHNRDFKDYAACVGIPAKGAKCYGNECRMPEAKSYNRKFTCGCVASNGYPVTIWSTRDIHATCKRCKNDFVEVPKEMTNGKVIEVSMSHVEAKGQDAVHDLMKKTYAHFERFQNREAKDMFVAAIYRENGEDAMGEQGVYQKNHNAYQEGFRYWVAFNGEHPADREDTPSAGKKARKPKPKAPPKSKASEELSAAAEEASATQEAPPRTYSCDNPQDIIDLYWTEGGCSQRKLAALLGIGQSTLNGRIQKFQINFTNKTFVTP